ncbi:hypothetical protein LNL84_03505 [Vibrio sp. ZSDZ34]|jgi:hypothetical protein|uniref:DNA polymerase III subunit beta n=1 Tax=Vibrio gelatinilyticus TaxID=2893468 RepID=A0A9X1WB61_9VIBR|nr:hypothetical protein [Vibrio gelatinilyticus]MCJ2375893.1 hypothetical protein [Vibrio gelatinilyticus]
MKKLITVLTMTAAMIGCGAMTETSETERWSNNKVVMLSKQQVNLESNLWIDKMPKVGETKALVSEQVVFGSLNLSSPGQIPADLDVSKVVIKQGEQVWLLEDSDFELRNHSEQQWEVAFAWQIDVNTIQPVDIAVELEDGTQQVWLSQSNVEIDTVY